MPESPVPVSKADLRRQLRQRRNGVSERVRRKAGLQVERLALRHRLIGRGRRIGFYIPANGELNILPLLNRALWMNSRCFLPVVPHHRQRKLWFTRLGKGAHWVVNRYGIPEYGHHLDKIRISRLERIFVPLLGFDSRGYRMGMGGGYYDASLAYLLRRRRWHRPKLIGVAFEAQKVEMLPADPWDIPLDAVLTERRYYRYPRQ
jgi:5-formyltetrahydrofolate cyclo-ligase